MAENVIKISFELENVGKGKAFKQTEAQAQRSGAKAGKNYGKAFSKSASSTISGLRNKFLGVAAAAIGVSKAIQAIGDSFRNLRGFSRSVAEINSILPKNQKLTEQSTQALIEFSKTFGTNQQKQAKAFYNIVSAGVKGTEKQLKTLAIANQAATAGLVDIDTAAKAVVSSVNAYSKSGLTATQASDALFVAVREGQTTFGELADFLGNATSIAANAGVSFDELAGSLAFVTKSGISTDKAAIGLRQVFASVISPTKEAADEALRLGIAFNASAIRAKTLAGFLRDVQEKTGGSEESLSKLFGNVRALAPVLNIVNGNFKEYNRIINETKNASGATAEAFGEIKKNIDFKLDQATQEWKAFGLNLLRVVSPAIRETAESLKFVGQIFNSAFKTESTKPLDVVNKKLSTTGRNINSLIDDLKNAKQGFSQSFAAFRGGKFEESFISKKLNAELEKEKELRKGLLSQRAEIINGKKVLAEQEKSIGKDIADSEVRNRVDVLAKLKELGVQTNEAIIGNMFQRMESLGALREQNLIDEQTYQASKLQIAASTNQQLMALEEQRLANSSVNLENIGASFKLLAKQTRANSLDIAKTVNNVMAKGVGNAFTKVGQAMAKGESATQAFADAMKAVFGDIASAAGDLFIKWGIANLATPATFSMGMAQIAGGGALKILAGSLGASGGGGGESAGATGGGLSTGLDTTGIEEQQEAERTEPSTNVEVVVQGSLVQQEELGTFIAETLSDSFGKQGVSLTDARIA